MIWFAVIAASIMITIPLVIMWGLWQIEQIGLDEIDWRDED